MPGPERNPLERPLAAFRRYKWLMLLVLVVVSAAGVLGTRFIKPVYQVSGTIWVVTETAADRERVGPIRAGGLLRAAAWVELLKSFRIVDEVARTLGLYIEPEKAEDRGLFAGFDLDPRFKAGVYELKVDRAQQSWALRDQAGEVIENGSAADSVGRSVGFRWELPPDVLIGSGERTVKFTVFTARETSTKMLDRLTVDMRSNSNFIWLKYDDRDSELAARTLNTWMTAFLRVAGELKKLNVGEFANILDEQVRFAERATLDAEAAFQRFKINTITLPSEGVPVAAGVEGGRGGGDPALNSFFEQKIAYDNLRNDREALERSIAAATAGSAPYEGLLLIGSVAQSPAASALRRSFDELYLTKAQYASERQTYTDEYPSVKDLKTRVDVLQNQTIPQLANQLLIQLRERENDLERRISSAATELQQIPPRTIEQMRLKRAVTVAEGLYGTLKSRQSEARLAEASTAPDVSILDTATAPFAPNKNTASRIILLAIASGFGAAIGLALLLDRLDRRIRYSEQVSNELGLGIAGAVPRIPKGGINPNSPDQVVQFVEAFRTLRMHVMSTGNGEATKLAIGSAAPADGKSLISSNLALSFADAGMRTVLVDGDTRRGAQHEMFGLEAPGGLTEYLLGKLTAEQAVRPTEHENLSIVTCGRRDRRTPELIASPKMKQLVDTLAESFDVVIVDTPPFAAGIDGYAIAAATGRMLMVLRMGKTERRLAAAKLAALDYLPVEIVGAVLNASDMKGEFQYYSYTSGYSIEAEEPAGELVAST